MKADDDTLLLCMMREYLEAAEGGRRVSRRALSSRHPGLEEELSACLQGLAFVRSAARQILQDAAKSEVNADPAALGRIVAETPG